MTGVNTPVDIRVPVHSLKSVKTYLEGQGILYTVMIEDLQVLLDEEQETMDSSARFAQPRTTDDFDYTNYHKIDEVSTSACLWTEPRTSNLEPLVLPCCKPKPNPTGPHRRTQCCVVAVVAALDLPVPGHAGG